MEIYKETDYRKILKSLVTSSKDSEQKITYTKLAEVANIPKSYLSKVLNANADLNQDQLYRICEFFDLDFEVCQYLSLLLEHDKSAYHSRKGALKKSIESFQARKLISKEVLPEEALSEKEVYRDYFYEPLNLIVHMALLVPLYNKDYTRICDAFNIPHVKLMCILSELQRLGIVEKEGMQIKVLKKAIYLPAEEKRILNSWKNKMRLLSLNYLQDKKDSDYSFSAVIAAKKEDFTAFKARFLDLLSELSETLESTEPEHVFQVNFDIHAWDQN